MKEFHLPVHKVELTFNSDRISGDTIHVIHSFSQNIWIIMMIITVTLRIKICYLHIFILMYEGTTMTLSQLYLPYLNALDTYICRCSKIIHLFLHNVTLALSCVSQIQIQPNKNMHFNYFLKYQDSNISNVRRNGLLWRHIVSLLVGFH
jgi:hypothetical protein